MREWLREVYVKRPDGFFHKSVSLLICNSMCTHITTTVKSEAHEFGACHHSGRINKRTPTVGHWCKQGVQSEVPSIVRDSKHTFNKTGRQQWGSYATTCGWIVDAWAKVSVLTVVWAFAKASIIAEQPPDNETDYDNDEREPSIVWWQNYPAVQFRNRRWGLWWFCDKRLIKK